MHNSLSHDFISGGVAGLMATAISLGVTQCFIDLPLLALILGCIISIPIFLTAFNSGTYSSIFAGVVAIVLIGLLKGPLLATIFGMVFFLPAIIAAWLLGLANIDEQTDKLKWLPLASAFSFLTIFIAIVAIFIGLMLSNNPSTPIIAGVVADTVIRALTDANWENFDANAFNDMRLMIINGFVPLVASVTGIYSLIFLVGNLYLSSVAARKLGHLKRPRDDWPQDLRLTGLAVIIFIVAFIISQITSQTFISIAAFIISSIFSFGFTIVGFAYLHNLLKPLRYRHLLLLIIYGATFSLIFTLPISIVVLMMGIWGSFQYAKQQRQKT